MSNVNTQPAGCCDQRRLTWGLSGSPRRWAAIYCRYCRHVYRRGVPFGQARLTRDEIEAELAGRKG